MLSPKTGNPVGTVPYLEYALCTSPFLYSDPYPISDARWVAGGLPYLQRYLCGILDPMPSSPVVCHLRREVLRRIDLLPTIGKDLAAEGTPGANGGVGEQRAPRYGQGIGSKGAGQVTGHLCRETGSLSAETSRTNTEPSMVCLVDGTRGSDGAALDYRAGFGEARWNLSDEGSHELPATAAGESITDELRGDLVENGDTATLTRAILPVVFESKGDKVGSAREAQPLLAPKRSGDRLPAGGPRARAVRFLLADSVPMVAQEVVDGHLGKFWMCAVCNKKNIDSVKACTTCGRHQEHSRHTSVRPTETVGTGVASRGRGFTRRLEQEREEAYRPPGGVKNAGSSTPVGISSKTETERNAMRSNLGAYDSSCFAKMRQTTEPAVKARLNLTGEIKSLLSAIRGSR